jgi:hypothetical protein
VRDQHEHYDPGNILIDSRTLPRECRLEKRSGRGRWCHTTCTTSAMRVRVIAVEIKPR